jgi:FkbM family methyltransferase
MFPFIKKIIIKALVKLTAIFSNTKLGKIINDQIIVDVMSREKKIIHNGYEMSFCVPNSLNHFRIDTFSEKEPETLAWIDTLPHNSILWDVGANIGLYSIYAAKAKNCRVIAFEPSVFNLELLARNIFLNNLQKQITIFPLALSNILGPNSMRLTTKEWGGALSSFGENVDWSGKPINDIFSFSTYGCSMDHAISIFNLPRPNFIKIDVDGIEHIILEGGKNILKTISGILIEINDDFEEQATKAKKYLENSGLVFDHKLQGEILKYSTVGFANTYNQIWRRK